MKKTSLSLLVFASLILTAVQSVAQNIQTPSLWSHLKHTVGSEHLDSEALEKFKAQKEHLSHYTYGVLAFQRKDYAEAKKFLNESLKIKELRPYVYYYLGQIASNEMRSEEALKFFNLSLNLNPQSDLKRHITFQIAKTYISANRLTLARQSLQGALKLFRRTEVYPDVVWDLLLVDQRLGRTSKCVWFKKLFREYPTHNQEVALWTLSEDTWSVRQGNKKNKLDCRVTKSDRSAHVRQLIALGQYEKTRYELNDPNLKLHELELFDLKTEFELRAGDPKKAFQDLKNEYERYKEDHNFLQLYTKAAARSLNHDEALKAYDERIRLTKWPSVKARLVFRKGFLEYELAKYEEAYNTFASVNSIDSNSIYRGDVYWYLGWTAYLQKKYDLAIEHFENLLNKIESRRRFRSRDYYSADRIKYWLAHSYRLKGVDTVANAHFREIINSNDLGYYSFLSAAFLNRVKGKAKINQRKAAGQESVSDPLLANLKVPWSSRYKGEGSLTTDVPFLDHENKEVDLDLNSQSFIETVQDNLEKDVRDDRSQVVSAFMPKEKLLEVFSESKFQPYVDRFNVLSQLGFGHEARWELYEIEQKVRTKEQKKALAILYYQVDDSHRASRILTINFAQERETPEQSQADPFYLWSSTYPQPHKKVVEASSMLFHVPENLVYSIMRAESFYSHQALSGAGARGLLQLMPFTANRVAGLLGKDDVNPDELFEPYINIQLGVRYLKRLLKTFEGDQVLAIAAYNAGPHRAEWWVSQFGQLRQDEFIEHVLFLETRNYVKKVMRFNWIYDLLYNAEQPTMSLADIKNPLGFQLTRGPSLTEQWDTTE